MAARPLFDEELDLLNAEMQEMGELVKGAIEGAFDALTRSDLGKARIIAKGDALIDDKERDIERLCLRLLLKEQPVATDLRTVTSALKMITDLERIGDQASEICEITVNLPKDIDLSLFPALQGMSQKAVDQVNLVIDAYLGLNMSMAEAVVVGDREIDDLFDELKQDITLHIVEHRPDEDHALDVLMIGKYLERIGDHVVNIAEWVKYAISGVHKGMTIAEEAE